MASNSYTGKAKSSDPYRVDGRATMNVPLRPITVDVADGPNVNIVSGSRVYASGT